MMKGNFVYLRPIKKEDMESFYNATQDEEIRYMTGTRDTISKEDVNNYYDKISKDSSRYDFGICLNDGDVLIGNLSILDIDCINHKAGFRIAIHYHKYFNKGYGTEAVKIALTFVFEELNLNRLQLEVYSHNQRGIKAYKKAGFKIEGIIRDSLYLDGKYTDEIIMGMLKKEYLIVSSL